MSETETHQDSVAPPLSTIDEENSTSVVRETYSSLARPALTKTPRNPNPQPIPAVVKPPRAAVTGSRARSSTSHSSASAKGKEKEVARFVSDLEPSNEARELESQGW